MSVLKLIIKNKDKVVTFDEIAKNIWQEQVDDKFSLESLAKIIQNLRNKIRNKGIKKEVIFTKRGRGYVFVLNTTWHKHGRVWYNNLMALIPASPDLSKTEKEAWENAQKKIKFTQNPPLRTVIITSGGNSYGNLRRVEQTTPVKAPVAQK